MDKKHKCQSNNCKKMVCTIDNACSNHCNHPGCQKYALFYFGCGTGYYCEIHEPYHKYLPELLNNNDIKNKSE